MISWVTLYANLIRTVIIAINRFLVEMIQPIGDERFMIFWHPALLEWVVCWKESVEETMEIASAYKTNIANLHWLIWVTWTWPPQGMSVRGIFDCKLFAEDLVVGHWDRRSQGNLSTPVGVRCVRAQWSVIHVYVKTCPTRMQGCPEWHDSATGACANAD
jgi:hypothetical protein